MERCPTCFGSNHTASGRCVCRDGTAAGLIRWQSGEIKRLEAEARLRESREQPAGRLATLQRKPRRMHEEPYGQECILDVHDIDPDVVFARSDIEDFCVGLCDMLGMVREDLVLWDYEGAPEEYKKAPAHLKGTSAVQFIRTSNITIHSLDELKRLYLNVFSCKPFDASAIRDFVRRWTGGTIVNFTVLTRV